MNLDAIFTREFRQEVLRLERIQRDWVTVTRLPNSSYRVDVKVHTWLERFLKVRPDGWYGHEFLGMKALGEFLRDGPKVFRPTKEQQAALEQVSVDLTLADYRQPYPALLVELDVAPFKWVLVYHDAREPGMLVANLIEPTHLDDIVTTVGTTEDRIEESLVKFDPDVGNVHEQAHRALRVAVNSCLALSSFPTHKGYLLPDDVARDQRFAKEDSERGSRARERLKEAVEVLTFSNEVKLHRTIPGSGLLDGSGREVSTHWRRGHWAHQVHGVGRSLRKLIYRAPVLVRADLFGGDKANTSTTYG